ncbi:tRNA (guanine-N(7)-)-methyltransferase non-catalytic subunit trm82 [Malassezia nana]|uniref:tRNA (Guanine-N(7)-)-methyltransferase non-catalytic subunit trm82 n=1 Tax=Malassezia nana TaxID=180528 RepID=A0AAF0EMP0_9BASI|nr:tRNA (guanine-N(7)-)-methyltransferase non-catalytic subunit trm82 [Malassezia nana]
MHGALHALPVQAVAATRDALALLTGANIVVLDVQTGAIRSSLDARIDARPGAPPGTAAPSAVFPRLCTFSPNGQRLAVASDDKVLRVWDIDTMEYGREVMFQRLAKRAGTLQWVESADGDEIVVADKFGDVWSFVVGAPSAQPIADTDVDGDADASLRPCLGHVSMITCLAFLPGDGAAPSAIVSCDRDEHIRISRWGPRRAAHVVEQYLLGSRSCVGAILVLPADRAARAGLPASDRPVLVSSDGGACLRVWCSEAHQYQLRATVHLDADTLASYVHVDAATERRRERAASNVAWQGAFDPSAPEPDTKRRRQGEEASENTALPHGISLVLQHLELFTADGCDWLLLRVEGAEAVFVVPLSAMAHDASNVAVTVCRAGAPILQTALVPTPEAVTLWACCDDRPGMGQGAALRRWVWQDGAFKPSALDGASPLADLLRETPQAEEGQVPEPEAGTTLVAVPRTPRALAPLATLSKLCLYSQVMTWPKPPQAPLDGSPISSLLLHQRTEAVARDMVERFQSGKRAAGRARNQASIQEQFGP